MLFAASLVKNVVYIVEQDKLLSFVTEWCGDISLHNIVFREVSILRRIVAFLRFPVETNHFATKLDRQKCSQQALNLFSNSSFSGMDSDSEKELCIYRMEYKKHV